MREFEPRPKIVGTATCPYGLLLGHDADSCRANKLADGRIYNVIFGRVSTTIPDSARKIFSEPLLVRLLVAELIAVQRFEDEPFRLTAVSSGDGVGAVAQGLGPEDVMTTVSLARGRFVDERIEISYTARDLEAAAVPEDSFGQAYDRSRIALTVPVSIDRAAGELTKAGYRLVHADRDTVGSRLVFVLGRRIPGSQATFGARATLTWEAM